MEWITLRQRAFVGAYVFLVAHRSDPELRGHHYARAYPWLATIRDGSAGGQVLVHRAFKTEEEAKGFCAEWSRPGGAQNVPA